jgi:hypothetical protein
MEEQTTINRTMEIGIDFDGTCVTHDFPRVGKDIGAQKVLKRLVEEGHSLILFTMRCDHEKEPKFKGNDPNISNVIGKFLSDAKKWFADNEIPLYGIQCNPSQHTWTTSPKCYAHLYIDDAALGCPLVYDRSSHHKPYVNWRKVEKLLEEQGFLKPAS